MIKLCLRRVIACSLFVAVNSVFAKDVKAEDYGVRADGKKPCTEAIQRAIDACAAVGALAEREGERGVNSID